MCFRLKISEKNLKYCRRGTYGSPHDVRVNIGIIPFILTTLDPGVYIFVQKRYLFPRHSENDIFPPLGTHHFLTPEHQHQDEKHAAWGEGVGLSVSPSSSSDRLSFAKTRVKIAGWVLGHAPISVPTPPPAPNQ
jgi:hypothetical protein